MKKNAVVVLFLVAVAPAAFADGGDNARALIERRSSYSPAYLPAVEASKELASSHHGHHGMAVSKDSSREDKNDYADRVIKANPENYRSK